MRREISTEFSTRIIDFENENISIVQKQWKFRISVPMSYIALGHHSQIAMEPNSASSAMLRWPTPRLANASKSQQIPANSSKSQQIPANPSKSQQIPVNPSKSWQIVLRQPWFGGQGPGEQILANSASPAMLRWPRPWWANTCKQQQQQPEQQQQQPGSQAAKQPASQRKHSGIKYVDFSLVFIRKMWFRDKKYQYSLVLWGFPKMKLLWLQRRASG